MFGIHSSNYELPTLLNNQIL